MKPDTSPAIEAHAAAQWVEGELVRSLMRTARNWQVLGLLLVVAVLGLLWDNAPAWQLAAWSIAGVTVSLARIWMLRRYAGLPASQQVAFFSRWRFLWPLSALVAGLTTLLFFDRAPLSDQFICWLFMSGMAMFSINSLAGHLPTMRGYINVLALAALGSMLWRMGVELRFGGPFYHYWVIALLLVFWMALLQAGRRLHMTHRTNFELQYRNNRWACTPTGWAVSLNWCTRSRPRSSNRPRPSTRCSIPCSTWCGWTPGRSGCGSSRCSCPSCCRTSSCNTGRWPRRKDWRCGCIWCRGRRCPTRSCCSASSAT
jgi:hypothetical protein